MEQIVTVWVFQSETRPDSTHRTMRHTNDDLSCTCEGWSFGRQVCKHVRWVEQGQADAKCVKRYDFLPSTKDAPMTQKAIAKVWFFKSESSSAEYQTIKYTDGSTSCDCKGWTRRVASDGSRSCKHTRLVDASRGDSTADNVKVYTTADRANQPEVKDKIKMKSKTSVEITRRFQFEDDD